MLTSLCIAGGGGGSVDKLVYCRYCKIKMAGKCVFFLLLLFFLNLGGQCWQL